MEALFCIKWAAGLIPPLHGELVETFYITANIVTLSVTYSDIRPQSRRDYPLNLSILISGGKETNKDSLSNGERKGKSPAPNLVSPGCKELWRLGRDIACAVNG